MDNENYINLFSRDNGLTQPRRMAHVPEEMQVLYRFITAADRYLIQPRPPNMEWQAHQCFLFDARKIAMATWELYCTIRENQTKRQRFRLLSDGPPREQHWHDNDFYQQPLQVIIDRLGLRYRNPDPWERSGGGGGGDRSIGSSHQHRQQYQQHASAIAHILAQTHSLAKRQRRQQRPPDTRQPASSSPPPPPPPRLPSPTWPDDYLQTVGTLCFLQPAADRVCDTTAQSLPSRHVPPAPRLRSPNPTDILHRCLGEMVSILKIKHDRSARRFRDMPLASRQCAWRFLYRKCGRIGFASYDTLATKQTILRWLAKAWNMRKKRHRLVVQMN
ncbi:hypothetical protein BCR42DRAFT_394795 [Absidia repens]|uniref:Uncharacterized protein n=1 Tax=Absidia repens TaxID=90262 RepID=A0A1X2I9X6_9FUNG|nr:hypothetical protein BCR42DRAFT_394795 [Absidia repens]